MAKEIKETKIFIAYEDQEAYDSAHPEKDLLLAMLNNAINDAKKRGPIGRKAAQYLLDPSDEYLFSFQAACTFLKVDPKKILRLVGVKQLKEKLKASKGVSKVSDRVNSTAD